MDDQIMHKDSSCNVPTYIYMKKDPDVSPF